MDPRQAALNLRADVEAMRERAEEEGWEILGPTGLEVLIKVTSSLDAEAYWIRFLCDNYPDAPFSVLPIDIDSRSTAVVAAWPRCEGFRPPQDICMPISREGFATHPEWNNDPLWRWDSRGNPLLRVVEEIQIKLNDPTKYQGRAA
jgi:hypothetical protein